MSWKNSCVEQEKILFIGDWLKQEYDFKSLCQRYGISRKTGYKLVNRYEMEGATAFEERSHCRHHHPNALPQETVEQLLALKSRFPTWGPEKIRDWLLLEEADKRWPAASTIGDLFKRYGLIKPRKYRRKSPAYTQPFSACMMPNNVWSADFKGQFKLGNEQYCYPLTVSDNFSRFLLGCDGLSSPDLEGTYRCFKRVFNEYGLPDAIRTDNGQPFAGVGIGGLTALSIWWLRLGILPERIQPGCPQQNGRHERMHRTLKEATARPAQANFVEQQQCFDEFRKVYNEQRPHQALGKKRPAQVYEKSLRPFTNRPDEVTYADNFLVRQVRNTGGIKWRGKIYYVSKLLYGQPIGLELIDDDKAVVYFSRLKIGLLDARRDKIIRP